jgi:hypothetical protein
LSREIHGIGVPTPSRKAEGNTGGSVIELGEERLGSLEVLDPADRPVKHESRLARGGFGIAGAGFEPATFGL